MIEKNYIVGVMNMNGARRRILVVEDDQETAGQLVDALGASG